MNDDQPIEGSRMRRTQRSPNRERNKGEIK
jgi:hypothetical protein